MEDSLERSVQGLDIASAATSTEYSSGPANHVLVDVHDDVATVTINRPAVRNAINADVVHGLMAAVEVAATEQVKVMVVRGADGTFCSGAELGEVLIRLECAPFPVVAAVEGYAVAGGCELLLACDVVVATTSARIGDGHVQYGLAPGAGSSVRLPARLPRAVAHYLLLSGELVTGAQAAEWGLVTFAVEAEEFDTVVARVVDRLASRGRDTLGTVKTMLGNAELLPKNDALRRERELLLGHLGSRDVRDGLAAFRSRSTADRRQLRR